MYWLDGHSYPERLAQLVPRYLKSLPTCPAAKCDSYSSSYRAQLAQDNFQLWCQGHHHTYENFPQYDGGVGLLEVPLDQLQVELPPEPRLLAAADLDYGRSEVARMIEDRPAMARLVQPGDLVYEWAARRFGGLSCGQRIQWYSGPVGGDSPGQRRDPRRGWTGQINIAKSTHGRDLSGQKQWSVAVSLLYDIANASFRQELDRQVLEGEGRLSRQQYIEAQSRLDYVADQNTQRFYYDVWVLFLAHKGIPREPSAWQCSGMETFAVWKSVDWDPKKTGYPYQKYGQRYENLKASNP